MSDIRQLFANNRAWARASYEADPEYFSRLVNQQSPEYLWIGCSDSRVPANQIIGLPPGEVFVHRNVANIVVHTDLNVLSVIQYAVEALKVKHILVVGHYGCGGVETALDDESLGLIDNWLRHVKDVRDKHQEILARIEDHAVRVDRLCELNVMQQVVNISQTTILQEAWRRRQPVTIHGWCYALTNGIVEDLGISTRSREEGLELYRQACLRTYPVRGST